MLICPCILFFSCQWMKLFHALPSAYRPVAEGCAVVEGLKKHESNETPIMTNPAQSRQVHKQAHDGVTQADCHQEDKPIPSFCPSMWTNAGELNDVGIKSENSKTDLPERYEGCGQDFNSKLSLHSSQLQLGILLHIFSILFHQCNRSSIFASNIH